MSSLKDTFTNYGFTMSGKGTMTVTLNQTNQHAVYDLTNPITVTVSKSSVDNWPTVYVWYDNDAVIISKTNPDDTTFDIGDYDTEKSRAPITFNNVVDSFGITITRKQGQTDPDTTISIGDGQPGGY